MAENEKVFDVVRLGDPVLRTRAETVTEELLGSDQLRQLAEDMIRTMMESKGVGLAAPQIGKPLRLFVYWLPDDDEGEPLVPPTVLINPDVRPVGNHVEEGWEGCLSIPGMRGMVARNNRVKVKARNLEGEHISLTADGFQARVIQHENDHLDGTVFIDRMESLQSLCFEEEWLQYHLSDSGDDSETAAAA